MTSQRRKPGKKEKPAPEEHEEGLEERVPPAARGEPWLYNPAVAVSAMLGDRRDGDVDMEELLQEIIRRFGGLGSFAEQIHSDWEQAPGGSVAKQRVMSAIMSLVARQAEMKNRREADLEGLSDADLQQTAAEFFQKRFPPLCMCPGCGLEFVPEELNAPVPGPVAAEPAPGGAGAGPALTPPGGIDPPEV